MASFFRTVDVRIWGDKKFRALSEGAKLAFLRLLIAPEGGTVPGLFSIAIATISSDCGMSVPSADAAMAELIAAGMICADWSVGIVYVVNALKHNPPYTPERCGSWSRYISSLPASDLITLVTTRIREGLLELGQEYLDAFDGGSPPRRNPVHEALRRRVIETHGMTCWLCSKPIADRSDLHLDHVLPHSRGGAVHENNLRPAHALCNIRRGNRDADDFRALLRGDVS
jgi:hypothetical protein